MGSRWAVMVVVGFLALSLISPLSAALTGPARDVHDWEQFGSDPQNTGKIGPVGNNSLEVLWEKQVATGEISGAIPGKTHVFVGTARGELLALSQTTGEEVWSLEGSAPLNATPALERPNLVFPASSSEHESLVFDVESKKLISQLGAAEGPVAVKDEEVFRGTGGSAVALPASSGEVSWFYRTAGCANLSAPTIVSDTVIKATYFEPPACGYGDASRVSLYALDLSTGEEIWRTNGVPWGGRSAQAVYGDLVFSRGSGNATTAVSLENGSVAWRTGEEGDKPSKQDLWHSSGVPPVVAQGRVLVSQVNYPEPGQYDPPGGGLTAFDADDGSVLWATHFGNQTPTSPVAGSHHIYSVSQSGNVRVLDPATGETADRLQLEGEVVKQPTMKNGRLFVSTTLGRLYAVSPGVASLELSLDHEAPIFADAEEHLSVRANNTGDVALRPTINVEIDGGHKGGKSAEIGPRSSTVLNFSQVTFPEPGNYSIRLSTTNTSVWATVAEDIRIKERPTTPDPSPEIRNVELYRKASGETRSVEVEVELANNGSSRLESTLRVLVDGEQATERDVRLDSHDSTVFRLPLDVPSDGPHNITAEMEGETHSATLESQEEGNQAPGAPFAAIISILLGSGIARRKGPRG